MANKVDVCAVADLEEGTPHIVQVPGGRTLVIALWRGQVFALRDVCPHQSQSFHCGTVDGRLRGTARPGEVAVDDRDPVVRCPWHTWEFRLIDGSCTTDPTLRIRTYPVTVSDGRVTVDLDVSGRRDAALSGMSSDWGSRR